MTARLWVLRPVCLLVLASRGLRVGGEEAATAQLHLGACTLSNDGASYAIDSNCTIGAQREAIGSKAAVTWRKAEAKDPETEVKESAFYSAWELSHVAMGTEHAPGNSPLLLGKMGGTASITYRLSCVALSSVRVAVEVSNYYDSRERTSVLQYSFDGINWSRVAADVAFASSAGTPHVGSVQFASGQVTSLFLRLELADSHGADTPGSIGWKQIAIEPTAASWAFLPRSPPIAATWRKAGNSDPEEELKTAAYDAAYQVFGVNKGIEYGNTGNYLMLLGLAGTDGFITYRLSCVQLSALRVEAKVANHADSQSRASVIEYSYDNLEWTAMSDAVEYTSSGAEMHRGNVTFHSGALATLYVRFKLVGAPHESYVGWKEIMIEPTAKSWSFVPRSQYAVRWIKTGNSDPQTQLKAAAYYSAYRVQGFNMGIEYGSTGNYLMLLGLAGTNGYITYRLQCKELSALRVEVKAANHADSQSRTTRMEYSFDHSNWVKIADHSTFTSTGGAWHRGNVEFSSGMVSSVFLRLTLEGSPHERYVGFKQIIIEPTALQWNFVPGVP